MQARGPLMVEHRLIERMVARIAREAGRMRESQKADPVFIDEAVDFFRTYADRTHHGKEEGLLFKALDPKPLSGEDRLVMEDLVKEHAFGRTTTAGLVEANDRYRSGFGAAISDILVRLDALADFYPRHIDKEDRVFFPATVSYLDAAEDERLLRAYEAFDRGMIHEKYRTLVEKLEKD